MTRIPPTDPSIYATAHQAEANYARLVNVSIDLGRHITLPEFKRANSTVEMLVSSQWGQTGSNLGFPTATSFGGGTLYGINPDATNGFGIAAATGMANGFGIATATGMANGFGIAAATGTANGFGIATATGFAGTLYGTGHATPNGFCIPTALSCGNSPSIDLVSSMYSLGLGIGSGSASPSVIASMYGLGHVTPNGFCIPTASSCSNSPSPSTSFAVGTSSTPFATIFGIDTAMSRGGSTMYNTTSSISFGTTTNVCAGVTVSIGYPEANSIYTSTTIDTGLTVNISNSSPVELVGEYLKAEKWWKKDAFQRFVLECVLNAGTGRSLSDFDIVGDIAALSRKDRLFLWNGFVDDLLRQSGSVISGVELKCRLAGVFFGGITRRIKNKRRHLREKRPFQFHLSTILQRILAHEIATGISPPATTGAFFTQTFARRVACFHSHIAPQRSYIRPGPPRASRRPWRVARQSSSIFSTMRSHRLTSGFSRAFGFAK